MVGVFRRSLSFPKKANPSSPLPLPSKPHMSHHTRSISLPCRSHPLISHLNHVVSQLRSWSSCGHRTVAWLSDGLRLLKDVHDSFADILQLPQSQAPLWNRPIFFGNLLEDLLRFVDAYGIFQTSALALHDHQCAAQVALRKKDESKINSYVKSSEKIAREIARLASTIQCVCVKTKHDRQVSTGFFGDADLASVIGEVISVTVSVSVALFNGVYLGFNPKKTTSLMGLLKREKKDEIDEGIEELKQVDLKSLRSLKTKKDEEVKNVLRRMRDLENCVCEIENGSEKVLRSLISTRVSLLNVLTN